MSMLPPLDYRGFCSEHELKERPDQEQIETAKAYLRLLKPTKRPVVSSYSLKHRAEHWGKDNGMEPYVSNGALIAAALLLGLAIKPTGINALIGVSQRSVKKLEKMEARS